MHMSVPGYSLYRVYNHAKFQVHTTGCAFRPYPDFCSCLLFKTNFIAFVEAADCKREIRKIDIRDQPFVVFTVFSSE